MGQVQTDRVEENERDPKSEQLILSPSDDVRDARPPLILSCKPRILCRDVLISDCKRGNKVNVRQITN